MLVSVEYCAPCRSGGAAARTRRVLAAHLREYEEIDAVTISPATEEVIRVSVGGERVWSVDPDGRVDPMEAVAAVRSRLATRFPRT